MRILVSAGPVFGKGTASDARQDRIAVPGLYPWTAKPLDQAMHRGMFRVSTGETVLERISKTTSQGRRRMPQGVKPAPVAFPSDIAKAVLTIPSLTKVRRFLARFL